jgi:hypothetical protein
MSRRTRRKQKITLPPDTIHDRQAKDLLRNAQVAPITVDDPMGLEPGDKITVLRSTRRDPLAWMHAHNQIDDVQYQAGRMWQGDWETIEQGAKAIDPSKEAVDGGRLPEPLPERRLKASDRLADVASAIVGADDRRILHAFLALGMGIEQIWLSYFGRYGAGYAKRAGERVRGILDRLAECYGLITHTRYPLGVDRASAKC